MAYRADNQWQRVEETDPSHQVTEVMEEFMAKRLIALFKRE